MKLIKFQLGGKNLPLTDVLKFQLNQVNPLTGKKPEIRGWEINNGELDVVTAESGTKLESKEATPFMNFFKFLIPGFKLAYDQKLALKNYDAKMKALYRVRIPLQEPPESIYKPKVQLAKKPLTTVALNKPITKHQEGGQFKEDLTPPSRGLFGEIGTNLLQGNEIMGKIVSSTPILLLLTGITSGIGGMYGPTMKVSKTAKELVTNPRNAIRKFSRNLNARKGDPTYRWTKTSGDIRHGGAIDYQYPGMGNRTRMTVSRTGRSEGSGYNALSQLNTNPTYLKASSPAQTPMQRTWNNLRAEPVEWLASRRVMQRNNLIDQARDWRNYIFESPRFGWANFKVIPK